MNSPERFLANSRIKKQEIQEFKVRGSLLRRGPTRRRAIEVVGKGRPVRVEPQPVVAEAEARSTIKRSAGVLRVMELITCTVDPEIVVVLETVRMGEQHDADGKRAEAKLIALHDFACPANRAAAMPQTELRRNEKDVETLLRFADLLPHGGRLGRLLELVGAELPFAPVLEAALVGLLQGIEHLLHGFAVRGGDRLPARDGEPAFRIRGDRTRYVLVGETNAGKQLAELVGLRDDVLRLLVAGEVAVLRADFLVLVLVGEAILGDESADDIRESGGVVDALRFLVGEACFVVGSLDDGDKFAALRVAMGDRRSQRG